MSPRLGYTDAWRSPGASTASLSVTEIVLAAVKAAAIALGGALSAATADVPIARAVPSAFSSSSLPDAAAYDTCGAFDVSPSCASDPSSTRTSLRLSSASVADETAMSSAVSESAVPSESTVQCEAVSDVTPAASCMRVLNVSASVVRDSMAAVNAGVAGAGAVAVAVRATCPPPVAPAMRSASVDVTVTTCASAPRSAFMAMVTVAGLSSVAAVYVSGLVDIWARAVPGAAAVATPHAIALRVGSAERASENVTVISRMPVTSAASSGGASSVVPANACVTIATPLRSVALSLALAGP